MTHPCNDPLPDGDHDRTDRILVDLTVVRVQGQRIVRRARNGQPMTGDELQRCLGSIDDAVGRIVPLVRAG